MSGPWEDFQRTSGPSGPWDAFGPPRTIAPGPKRTQDLADAVFAGLQNSATGLALRGKMPDQVLAEDAPWYHRLAANAAGMAADIPVGVVGAIPGIAKGGAIAGPAGAAIGGAAGGFAAPMALRDALITAYNHNEALSWTGVWDIAKSALVGGAKGAVIGGVTGGAGRFAGQALAASGKVTAGAGALGAELGAMTAASSALEGHLPSWQDFMDNAILLGGMKGAVALAGKMRRNYAETGKRPEEQVGDAMADPALKAEMLSPDQQLPKAYEPVSLEQRVQAAVEADPRPEFVRQTLAATPEKPTKLGTTDPYDPVKWEYVTDRETSQGVLRVVTEMFDREIQAQTRGVVTNKQTAVDALRQVASGDVVAHAIGAADNASTIYARAYTLRSATNHAVGELQKLADLPAADLSPAMKLQALAAIERVAMLNAEFAGVRAEAGRALQIFRAMKRDPGFLGDAEALLKVAERKGNIQDIAKMVAEMKDPAQAGTFMREYARATTMEKVIEAWKAGILSGPVTHVANVIGNLTKIAIDVPESMIAATLTAAQRAAKGDPLSMAQWKARAFAPINGVTMGAMDALKAAGEAWRTNEVANSKGEIYRQAIEGKTGEVVRLPFKLLQVEDAFFRTFGERAEAYKLAVDRAVKEGFHPETREGREAVATYLMKPETGLEAKAAAEVLGKIEQAGVEAVFSQRLGPRLEMVQRAMAGSPMQFVVPFVRTPANLVSWSMQHSPLFFLSKRWRDDWAAGGERQAQATARVVIGAGLTIAAVQMAQDGMLTGGGLFDKETGATKKAAGWQPYSILVDGTYYSYQRIEPVAKVLGFAADMIELMAKSKTEEDRGKIASMIVLMFGNATISTTYLSGLSATMQAITDPARYGQNWVEQYASSVVPKIIGQTTMLADPYKREVEGVADAIQAQIPFLREKLLPKRDVWGEPVKNDRWFDVMPVTTSEKSEEKVRTEAARLALAIADAPRFVQEKGPLAAKQERAKLEPEQRDIYREVSGKQAMAILTPIVNSPDWERIPDFAKGEVYKKVIERTRKLGEYAALPPDAPAREALRRKILDEVIRQQEAVK